MFDRMTIMSSGCYHKNMKQQCKEWKVIFNEKVFIKINALKSIFKCIYFYKLLMSDWQK